MFSDRGAFWGPNLSTSVKLCQFSVPFFPICKKHYSRSGPVGADPICPQPRLTPSARPFGMELASPLAPFSAWSSEEGQKGSALTGVGSLRILGFSTEVLFGYKSVKICQNLAPFSAWTSGGTTRLTLLP